MDLLLNREAGSYDLAFVNGECPTTTDAVDRTAQRLYIRLKTFFGEWWWDTTYGVPWLEKILGYKVRKQTVDMILQEQILLENGVIEIVSFNSSLDNSTRAYTCSFRVRTEAGITNTITV